MSRKSRSRFLVIGYAPLAIVIAAVTIWINFIFLNEKYYPLRWISPGLALMIVMVLYPIIFEDRLELLLGIGERLYRASVEIDSEEKLQGLLADRSKFDAFLAYFLRHARRALRDLLRHLHPDRGLEQLLGRVGIEHVETDGLLRTREDDRLRQPLTAD